MMKNEFQNLIDRLVQRMDIERIFKFSFPWEGQEQNQLLIVINPVKGMAPKALAPLVSLCLSDTEPMPFDIIIAGEWQNQIKQGSLYYTYVSLPQHQCYVAKKKPNLLFSSKSMTGLLELSQFNYNKSRELSDEFRSGVANFLTKDDYPQATFMLHQYVELRLKGFMGTAGMNGGKGHNLEHLLKTVRTVLPRLQELFPYDIGTADLLRKLDESYVKAKKLEQVEISKAEFDLLLEKCEIAADEMDSRVDLMVGRITVYRDKLTQEQESLPVHETLALTKEGSSSKPKASEVVTTVICEDFADYPWLKQYKTDVNRLLDKIRTNHNPEQITMLNYHTGGFSGGNLFQQSPGEEKGAKVELYLVVIMKNTGPFHFRCMKVGVASAMVLYLDVSYIERNLAEGNRFVNTLWTKGRVLRRKSTFEPQFEVTPVDWKEEVEEVSMSVETTKHFIESIRDSLQIHHAEVEVNYCILKCMLEAVVMTYLYGTVGYVPKDVSMRYLVDWTGVCSRELICFLLPKDEDETTQLYLFLRPDKMWMGGSFAHLCVGSFLDESTVQAHLEFYDKLMDSVLQQSKALAEQGSEADV